MECIICLETEVKKISVASLTLDSFLKLLERSRQWAQYMDNSVMGFIDRKEILTLRINSPRMLLTTKLVM